MWQWGDKLCVRWQGGDDIVVTYFQFDSNIRVLYVFLGFFKNTWKYLIQRPIFKPLYNYNVFFKYLKILLFEHLWKILVFCMSLLCKIGLCFQKSFWNDFFFLKTFVPHGYIIGMFKGDFILMEFMGFLLEIWK
jgi:hypothetical protein